MNEEINKTNPTFLRGENSMRNTSLFYKTKSCFCQVGMDFPIKVDTSELSSAENVGR